MKETSLEAFHYSFARPLSAPAPRWHSALAQSVPVATQSGASSQGASDVTIGLTYIPERAVCPRLRR